uniref:Leucine-rich repeat-containing protein 51 n=1 Tax=Nothobranchius furzeri TaxID=105023 RepID=A0A8C6P6J1_NOTFU
MEINGPPVDFCFYKITDISDVMSMTPLTGLCPLRKNSEQKYLSRSIRLRNNNLTNISGLELMIAHFLAQPSNFSWLDMSFNQITAIDPVLCELKHLSDLNKLAQLSQLHSITLHENAVEKTKGYRWQPDLFKTDILAVLEIFGVAHQTGPCGSSGRV